MICMRMCATVVFVLLGVLPAISFAAKTTYITTNHRFNYVKLHEISDKEAALRGQTHPVTLDEIGVRAALMSINLSRDYLIKKDVDTQQVFDETAANYLAPALVQAFKQAKPNEEVEFSYLSKNPIFIMRNDRLNMCTTWVHDNELHVRFDRLYAKITGDIDKRGNEGKAISRSQSLRVKLDLGEGQTLGVSDPDEIILNLSYNYVKKPEPKPEIKEGVTMSGDKIPLPTTSTPRTAKERLKDLEQLKKDGLINKTEYEEKKKEILKEL